MEQDTDLMKRDEKSSQWYKRRELAMNTRQKEYIISYEDEKA
jgi:hypothetical protein